MLFIYCVFLMQYNLKVSGYSANPQPETHTYAYICADHIEVLIIMQYSDYSDYINT